MNQETPALERRKWPRVEFTAMAHVLSADGTCEVFGIENLSAGGALLVGDNDLAPGAKIRVSLELANHGPITINAVVVRSKTSADGGAISAVAFQISDSNVEDIIHQAVLLRLEELHRHRVALRAASAPNISR
jgi:hypothetical protein